MPAPLLIAERAGRPQPNAEDWRRAREFIRDTYENDPAVSRRWLEFQRDNLTRCAADAEMQKRMHREWKAGRQTMGRAA